MSSSGLSREGVALLPGLPLRRVPKGGGQRLVERWLTVPEDLGEFDGKEMGRPGLLYLAMS